MIFFFLKVVLFNYYTYFIHIFSYLQETFYIKKKKMVLLFEYTYFNQFLQVSGFHHISENE